jgi:subtilisin family serine protease
MMRFSKRILISFVLFIWPCLALAGRLTPDLQERMGRAGPDERIRVIVRFVREADLSAFSKSDREGMVRHLRVFAAESQRGILAALPGYGEKVAGVKPFWIYNGIAMEATKEVILDLLKRPEVGYIEEDRVVKLEPLPPGGYGPGIGGLEWNIQKIEADSVWSVLDFTGQGIVVGNIDTGVLTTHETFGGRFRGGRNSWFDALYGRLDPYDDNGHGTYTMGTICGGSTADTIGVARGAKFVCAKAFDEYGSGWDSWIDACYQWFAGLGSAAPDVVGNSWGCGGYYTHFWQISRTLQTLGIHQVFSNGNSGPGSGTVLAPASYPHHIGVGATDSSDGIAGFSSRGPSPAFGAMESVANYLDPAWGLSRRKPDISAPGVAVRSAYRDGGYVTANGTSIASPHVTGTIALMLQKNDQLADTTIWRILAQSCDTPPGGGPYPNQNYGWGRLNAYRAVQMTPPGYSHFMLLCPAAETLLQNASVVDSVTVISMGGFCSPVTMTLDSIRPAEPTISISFNPNPVTPPPNGTIQTGMRITTQPGTPAGDYVLFYHGIGDTVARHASIDLNVGVPAFNLRCAQSDSVKAGDVVVDSVTVISRYYFSSPVTMILDSIRPAESTISVAFDPNPVTPPPNGSIQTGMRISTQVGTPVWTYRLYFHAVGDTIIRHASVALKVYGPTFDLTCVPSDSVGQGAFKVDSVTVTSRYGFSSPVAMTLDSIRPEEATISVSFDPNPVTPLPNDSIKTGMRITTQSGTPLNNYRLYFRGTGNLVTRLSMILIKVNGPSFDLHYSQSYSLSPGDTVRDSIGVLSRYNFSSPVTMTLDSIRPLYPYDTISVAFDPNPVTPPPNDSVRTQICIATKHNLYQGYYRIYGHGSGGSVTKRFTIYLSVFIRTFDMVQAASAEALVPDTSVVDSVYLYSRGSFSAQVTMSLDSIRPAEPAISVDFNPNPVWVTPYQIARSGMRIRSQSGTPLGDYMVYYRGSGVGITHCLAVGLKVVAQPFEVRSAPGCRVVQQWCASTDYNLTVNSLVSYPISCTLSATVDFPQSSIVVGIVGDSVLAKSGYRTLRVRPNQEMTPGTYGIKVQARSGVAVFTLEDTLVYAVSYYLGPAMPSPSRGSTVIPYGLPVESPVSLKVYDLSGRLVRILVLGSEKAGYHKVSWDGRAEGGKGVGSGVYFYRLVAGSWTKTMKMVVIK